MTQTIIESDMDPIFSSIFTDDRIYVLLVWKVAVCLNRDSSKAPLERLLFIAIDDHSGAAR